MSRKSPKQKRAEKLPKRPQQTADRDAEIAFQLPSLGDEPMTPKTAQHFMEAMLRGLSVGEDAARGDSPQLRAMELCDQAKEAGTTRASKLARQALEVWADCAAAYVILAELATSVSEALPLYEQGVVAGRRGLVDEWDWIQDERAFWGYLPTRPFMRALLGLAETLWCVGRREDAAERYCELLKTNPNDNQGVRYIAVPKLIEIGRHHEARRILKHYSDYVDTFTAYNLALLEFREHGDSAKARRLLKKSFQANEYVPAYLASNKVLPSRRPDAYAEQTPEEAQIYVDLSQRAWNTTPGAIAWLRSLWSPASDDESPICSEDLLQLPQGHETWLLLLALGPSSSSGDGVGLMLVDLEADAVVGSAAFPGLPTPTDIWTAIAQSFANPLAGVPRRPQRVEFLEADLCAELRHRLENAGVEAGVTADEELRARYDEGLAGMSRGAEFSGDLSALPIAAEEAWLAVSRQLDTWIRDETGQLQRPWVLLVMGQAGILAVKLTTKNPSAEDWQHTLREAIGSQLLEEPSRPGQLLVLNADQRLLLEPTLEGIPCRVCDDPPVDVDAVFEDLTRTLDSRIRLTPYVQQDGMTAERVGRFFSVAAEFYRCAPWSFTPTDAVWEIQSEVSTQPWFAIVMGQNGETFGLTLVERFDDCVRLMSGKLADGDIMNISTITLSFDEAQALTGADLDAVEQFGWPVVAPEAYPLVYRTGLSASLQTPSAADFDLLEAALQTLPDFIRSHSDSGTVIAQLRGQPVEVRLAQVPPKELRRTRRRRR